MSYTYADGTWLCSVCGRISTTYPRHRCEHCGGPHTYEMTYAQARAVSRRLNNLETENKGLSAVLAAATLSISRAHQKQPCGHEYRYVAKDKAIGDWCTLCEVEGLEQMARMWAHDLLRRVTQESEQDGDG